MKGHHKRILLDLIGDAVSGTVVIYGRPSGRAFWDHLTLVLNRRIQNQCGNDRAFNGYAAHEVVSRARELRGYYKSHKNDAPPPRNIEKYRKAFSGGRFKSMPSEHTMLGFSRPSRSRRNGGQISGHNDTEAASVIVKRMGGLRSDGAISIDEALYGWIDKVNGTHRGRDKAQKLLMLFREQRQRDSSPQRVTIHSPLVQEFSTPLPERKQLNKSLSEKAMPVLEPIQLGKSASRRKLGRTFSFLWKGKNFSASQC